MTAVDRTDTLQRFVFEGAAVRGARVRLSATSRAILASHSYPPSLERVLGELCGAASLLAAVLEFDGSLIVQIAGEGPVRLIVVECNRSLALRATAQWDDARVRTLGEDARLDALAGRAGKARLAIMLDPRAGGPVYQGVVAIESESVATTIEHYLVTSEQVASKLALVVREGEVAGLLLQRMPASGPTDDLIWVRALAALDAATLTEIIGATTDDAGLIALFAGDDLRVFSPSRPRFECSCSRARVEGALRIAGREEIEAALREGAVEVICEFCGRKFTFAPDEARALFAAPATTPSGTRH